MTFGERLQARTQVEDASVILWEAGAKTVTEIKREILDLVDQADSLVAVVDLKRAERPDDPWWWPSLSVVHAWIEEDPFFAKAIDRWRHARQERILESIIWDLHSGKELTKAQLMVLKERVKFSSSTLPLMVNKGMRQKVDVETTNNHLHLHSGLSDEALKDKLNTLRRNPLVIELLKTPMVDGAGTPTLVEGEVIEPPAPRAGLEALDFKSPEALGQDLMGGEAKP